eukprot:14847171-Alexandrium_andersonii.AAC.1
MPVPPWDTHYDLWGLGPDPAVIHEQPSRQVCTVVSLPLVRQHIARKTPGYRPEEFLRVDSTGHL